MGASMSEVLPMLLVLPEDVLIAPVREFPGEVRQLLGTGEHDYAVSRHNARETTRLVSSEGAGLLEFFRRPTTIVQAIIAFSRERVIDPEATLERALPLVTEFMTAGFLVPAGSSRRQRTETSLAPGSTWRQYSVIRCVQVFEDSEVYQARTEEGQQVALKLSRPGFERVLAWQVRREVAVLASLDAPGDARLLEHGSVEGQAFIVTSWRQGTDSDVVAAELRKTGSRQDLLALLQGVAHAYASLHARGVVHGDVHPRNVLVDRSGAATIIDFGLAIVRSDPGSAGQPGGIGFFVAPETAEAWRSGQTPRPVDECSEQYGVGALLYLLASGHQYVDFSLQREQMLSQIVEELPVAFAARGLDPWPQVEEILTRALDKEPVRRYPSVTAFAAALDAADPGDPLAGSAVASAQRAIQPYLSELVADLDIDGTLFRDGLPQGPICSVQLGASGIAYALYRLASTLDEPRYLALADVWIARALRDVGRDDAFANPAMQLMPVTVGRISPYHTSAGVHLVHGLIGDALGEEDVVREAVHAFLHESAQSGVGRDVALGPCGTVLGCALLLQAIADISASDRQALVDAGRARLTALWQETAALGPANGSGVWANLGIAHGWAGLMYVTLRWAQLDAEIGSFLDAARSRLEELLGAGWSMGRGLVVSWQDQVGPSDRWMPGWCNGSAGLVHLGCVAYAVLGGERYLDFAERAAWAAWESEPGIVDLCCGLAGRAYALLALHRVTGAVAWLRRATRLTEQAVSLATGQRGPERPRHSLYKGELGLGVLIADLEQPAHASMPMFGPEGASR